MLPWKSCLDRPLSWIRRVAGLPRVRPSRLASSSVAASGGKRVAVAVPAVIALAIGGAAGGENGLGDDAAETPRVIRRSDVVFMYDNPALYEAYGCTVMGWAGRADREHIAGAHQKGVRVFASSVGFRTEFAGMIDFSPRFAEARCLNFAGEPFIVPWLWDHKHKGEPAWWFCTNSPLYRSYLRQRLERVVASGADALHIDDYTATAGAVTWLDACFCPDCMKGFREYLRTRYDAAQLRESGITDLDAFDYGEFLRRQGITPERYHRERTKLPLADAFLDFHVRSVTDFVAEFRREGERRKGGPLPLAVNSNLNGPMNLAITPHLSYFCCELDHRAASREVPLQPVYAYKLADGLHRSVTSTASGGDWAYINEHRLPGLVRTWAALSYAFGHNLMAPHRMWCYTQHKGTHWYAGPTEEYAWLYRFVREHADLFDAFEAAAPVAVLYDNHSQRQGKGSIRNIVQTLTDANVPFAVVVQGDDWLPGYRITGATLARHRLLVVPADLQPDPELAALLQAETEQGRAVVWSDVAAIHTRLGEPVRIQGTDRVLAVPRVRAGQGGSTLAVHLLNRAYRKEDDRMDPRPPFQVLLSPDVLGRPAETFRKATVYAPRAEPVEVRLQPVEKGLQIEVPGLDFWSIVELQ